MRIVAGTAKGRPLQGPKNAEKIRPTADRVRETLFNILGQFFDEGTEVLDLYAGTGALALEALSRGCSRAVLVDQDREAITLCRDNAAALGFAAQIELLPMSVDKALTQLARSQRRFSLILADPPYDATHVQKILEKAAPVLLEGGRLVIEHGKKEASPQTLGPLVKDDERRFGDTVLSLYSVARSTADE
jgi:16S rRNA (guanine966-N2)-methyltransferase